jgi:hypothetical protein
MANTSNIREHMPVVASDGKHVGIVDHLEGQQIKLTRNDPSAQGQHHYIPANWVDSIDEHVHLNKTSQEVTQQWTTDS